MYQWKHILFFILTAKAALAKPSGVPCTTYTYNCIYRSLGKIQREKIFIKRHVRRKLNT